ncbi:mitochondrial ribonuclease P catalytic subunit [Nilaparvata lugens]|uniref:mitochondrial ribonuclease P catalytic subunit n=1 Tax=Nilaparvata lugens TaxID=108931 RepID=UPI00193E1061|nr:mitochondrial ribonuclease P catalytic subunit [Nilaparvata lugens]
MLFQVPVSFLKGKSCRVFVGTGMHVAHYRTSLQTLTVIAKKSDTKEYAFQTFTGRPTLEMNKFLYGFSRSEKNNPFRFCANFYSSNANPNKTLHDIIEEKNNRSFLKRQMVDDTNDYMEHLSTKTNISVEEWSKLREMLLQTTQFNTTEKNVETVLMKLINRYNIFRFARLYFNHLKSLSVAINPATLALYVRYMYSFKEQCTAEDFLDAEEICQKLLESSPMLSPTTAENVICGFSVTKNWEKSLEIFNKMKEFDLSRKSYNAVGEACFRNRKFETGWEIVESFGKNNWQLSDNLTSSVLSDSLDKRDAIMKLLNYYKKYFDRPNLECAQKILTSATQVSKGRIKPAYTRINDRGICQNCRKRLVNNSVNEEEYEKLRSSFLNPVLIGRDIFQKSNPEELSDFQRILKSHTPFDFVLDGLNIAYSATTAKCKDKTILSRNLLSVVNFLLKQRKKLLVIGRKHMMNWPRPFMEEMNKKCYFFLAEDVTHDDTYLLYASLYSGIRTNFVSRDLMRGYRYLLNNPELESIFWRWQYQHQYLVVSIRHNGAVEFQTPVPYRQDCHSLEEDDRIWHVPCLEEVKPNTPGYTKLSNKTWLCLPLDR